MKKMTVEEREMIKSMLKRGMVGVDIADKTGRSLTTIGKIRQEIERFEGSNLWHNGGAISSTIKI